MAKHDPRVDAYIEQAADFAQPILLHLRAVIHETCSDVEEGIKWGMPFFSHRDATMCMMAAFKQHCSFRFWLGNQVVGNDAAEGGMGQFGKLTSRQDLPGDKQLVAYIRKAMKLAEAGTRLSRPKAPVRPAAAAPDDLATLLAQKRHAAARRNWAAFGPGAQREYVEWINEARTDGTRQKRLATTMEWLAEGKKRNWRYAK